MRPSISLSVATALLGALAAQAQAADCATAQFSQSVLDRFPNIRNVCSDVIEKDGVQYAVIKGDLVRTANNAVWVKFKQPDGTHGDARKIETKPEFRVKINGTPTSVRNLAVGQELTAYVKVSDPVVALEPAEEVTPLAFTPLATESPMLAANQAEMPRTASSLPTLGLLGGFMLALAGLLTFLRLRRES